MSSAKAKPNRRSARVSYSLISFRTTMGLFIRSVSRISGKKGVVHRGGVNKYQVIKDDIQLIPSYENDKTTVGPDVAEYIGLEKMMSAGTHFS